MESCRDSNYFLNKPNVDYIKDNSEMNTSVTINSKKGYVINVTIYKQTIQKNVLVICSAIGVKQTFYKKIAKYFQENDITVITFDYSGIGNSLIGNIKNSQTTLTNWGNNDLEAVLEYCEQNYPNTNLTILGHSIGGQLVGLTKNALSANKIILICSQSGYWGHWDGIEKLKMWLNWNILFPALIKVFGYMPSKKFSRMENLPKNVAIEWKNWCCSKNYLFDFIDSENLFFEKFKCKLVSYSVENDQYAPKKAVDWLTGKFKKSNWNKIHIKPIDLKLKPIGHFGLFREKYKDSFWKELKNEIITL